MLTLDYNNLGYGITSIESGYQRAGLACCYLLENPLEHAQQLHRDLDAYVEIALALNTENRYENLLEQMNHYHLNNIQIHGCHLPKQETKCLILV